MSALVPKESRHPHKPTVFDVPLIKFRGESLLELIDIGLDPGQARVILGRVHGFGVTQQSEVPEIEVIFCKLEGVLYVIVFAECVQDV